MQILSRSYFYFDKDQIDYVVLDWEFDDFFSADVIMTYDLDGNKSFDKKETEEIYNNAFISLKDYHYFTYIRLDGEEKRVSPDKVENFEVFIGNNGRLVYSFSVDLGFIGDRDFYLSTYDFTYFCACFYQEESPVMFFQADDVSPKYEIKKNEDYPIYFNPYAGIGDNTVYDKWEEGLSEIVIKEIFVQY